MTCIYCKRDGPARGVEHVYPEGLGKHDMTLPKGAVCDACNNAFSKLDHAVLEHPHISATLFEFGIPGKDGRPRQRHGYFERTAEGGLHLRTPIDAKVHVDHETRQIFIQSPPPPQFHDHLFVRGLFKIALNLVAHVDGVEAALGQHYDAVRRYVKAPKSRAEIWPYVQRELLGRDVQDVDAIDGVRFRRYRDAERDSICMSLLSDEFYVSLLDPDAIESMVRRSNIDRSKRVLFHGRDGAVRDWAGDVLPPVSVLPRTG